MAKSHKSATLPSNLRHSTLPPTDDGDNFFTRLKKKFKFRKGRYNVDVNTGECENISVVSFKKRESSEIHVFESESPLKYQIGRSSERETRSASPKLNKPAARSHSDRYMPTQFAVKHRYDKKSSSSSSDQSVNSLKNSKTEPSELHNNTKSSKAVRETIHGIPKGNEYSCMKFDKEEGPVISRPRLSYPPIPSEQVSQDDSAIDLDHCETDQAFNVQTQSSRKDRAVIDTSLSSNRNVEPGCVPLPVTGFTNNSNISNRKTPDLDFEPGYASVKETQRQGDEKLSPLSNPSEASSDFDPNYESVSDVKNKIQEQFDSNRGFAKTVDSVDSLVDPHYQSVGDVKKPDGSNMRSSKTYDVSKSIESLDEPGYESLNDVKNRISAQNFGKTTLASRKVEGGFVQDGNDSVEKDLTDMNDSALSLSEFHDSMAEMWKEGCDTGKLTESSKSKDSGFGSKESSHEENTDSSIKTNMASCGGEVHTAETEDDPKDLYSTVKKVKERKESVKTGGKITGAWSESAKEEGAAGKAVNAEEVYDSDTELVLDPGYAECADAIKGVIPVPFSAYSDGSSKMSSCASLDLSAEDFTLEPGYAECADAIKTGAIKKISVSHEKLVESVNAERREPGSDIYANPQILFRKRSKLLEELGSGEFSNRTSGVDFIGSSESLNSNSSNKVCKPLTEEEERKAEEQSPPEAPPLPARNYSLYLDSEEIETVVPDCEGIHSEDDAFEKASTGTAENSFLDEVDEVSEKLLSEAKKTDCTNAIICDEICDIVQDMDETDSSSEIVDCLQVVVEDKSGCKKVLTVTEKETFSQNRKHTITKEDDLKEDDVKQAEVDGEGSESCSQESSNLCQSNQCCDSSESFGVQNVETSEKLTHCDVNTGKANAYQTSLETDADSEHVSDTVETGNLPVDTDMSSCAGSESKSADVDASISPNNNEESSGLRMDDVTDMVTDVAENVSVLSDVCKTVKVQEKSPQCVHQHYVADRSLNLLELGITPVKMQSISTTDSDSDDCIGVEHLPKLEINESDLVDDAFLVEDSETREILNKISDLTMASKEPIVDKSCDSDLVSNSLYCSVEDTSAGVNAKDKKATLESRLCVIDSETGDLGQVSEIAAHGSTDHTLSESSSVTDSTSEKCDKGHRLSSSAQSDSNDESSAHSETECDSPTKTKTGFAELAALKDPNPNLYLDTEPTHMSLNEVLSKSGSRLNQYPSPSGQVDLVSGPAHARSDNETNYGHRLAWSTSPQTSPRSNIPVTSSPSGHESQGSVPPPRPPTYLPHHSSDLSPSSGQSCFGLSGSTSSSEPAAFRFVGSGQSDEDTPPAVPPRSRVRRQPPPASPPQDFMESMRQLKDCGWYWGPLSWGEAEIKLANKPEGTFLVRDSSDERYILSLSFKNQGHVHHTRIEHHKGHFSFWSQPDSHGKSTIKEFIEQCVTNSRNGRFLYFIRPSGPGSPPMPIHLLHPVSRFAQMRSLQHMCRFRILQLVRRDHIDHLPIPTRIKQYLKEAQYYVEYLDD